MTTNKKYTDEQWEFIRDYELADRTFAEFMTRYEDHRAKQFQPDCGMTPADIRKHQEDFDIDYRLSAEDLWEINDVNFLVEHNELLYDCGLRARAEAAWRARPIQRIRDAFRVFLRELSLPE